MLNRNDQKKWKLFLELCSTQQIETIRNLQESIIKYEVQKIEQENYQKLNKDFPNLSLHISRILVSRLIINPNFTKAMTKSIVLDKAMNYPMPESWSEIISKKVKVNRIRCKLYFIKFIIVVSIKESIKYIFKLNKDFRGILKWLDQEKLNLKSRTIVIGLSEESVKSQSPDKQYYNFNNWYLKNFNSPLIFLPVPPLRTTKILRSMRKTVSVFLASVSKLLTVKCNSPFYLKFIILGRFAELYFLEETQNRVKYDLELILVESGLGMEVPIWLDWFTNRGVKTCWFSQSFNLEPYNSHGERPLMLEWMLNTWDRALGQSYQDCVFIKKNSLLQNIEVQLVKPIWFIDFNYVLPDVKNQVILVFDTEPHLGFYGSNLLFNYGLADIEYIKRFLLDIVKVATENNWQVIHKPKRYNIRWAHPEYKEFLKYLKIQFPTSYLTIDPRVSAFRLYDKYKSIVISYPLSSVSAAIRNLGGDASYYDPTSKLIEKHKLIDGVEMIAGTENLESFLKSRK